jgi:FkbM family methyltransferase
VRTFVDIGSHVGQTIAQVTHPRWGFDRIHAIEPMPRELKVLHWVYRGHPTVRLHGLALTNGLEGSILMYGDNELLEASMFPTKNDVDPATWTSVPAVDAGWWFMTALETQDVDGEVYVNLNAEGAEIDIIDSLHRSDQLRRITALLVDFDCVKVPGHEKEEKRIRKLLDDAGVNYTSDYPDRETHGEMIAAWLENVMWP